MHAAANGRDASESPRPRAVHRAIRVAAAALYGCALASAATLAAAPATAEAALLSFRDVLNHPAPGLKADQRIPYGAEPLQFADLWLPKGKGPHPVVVLIHGGCWLASLPGVELTHFMADALRNQGFAVWEVEYRRVGHGGGGYPGTFTDIAAATDHLRTIAGQYALDLNRVIASGHSAGGHLALWLAARPRLPADSRLRSASPLPIHAVVGVAAIGDLAHFAKAGAHACGDDSVDKLVAVDARGAGGPAGTGGAFRDTSPAALLPLGVKQVLLHGTYDGIVPPAIGMRHKTQAAAKGERVELLAIADAGHFELIAPWTPAWKEVANAFARALAAIR